MKTCLWSPCRLTGVDANGDSYLERYQRYIDYYRQLKTQLGFDDFVFIDNASSMENLMALNATIMDENLNVLHAGATDLRIVRCDQYLGRGRGFDYPYCWRQLYAARAFMQEYDKFIFLDSDCFVLSGRMAKWIKELNSGWSTIWCDKYNFPEAALSILCKDSFHILKNFCVGNYMHYNGNCFELSIPYTSIERQFSAGRFGEENIPQQPWMDFYGQARTSSKFVFLPDSILP